MKRHARFVIVSLLVIAVVSPVTWAQVYPARPIRFIVGYPPGGAVDVFARIIGAKLSDSFGQQIVIDNRTGAATVIASEIIAKAAPDGYTLFMQDIPSHAINAALYKKLPYDPVKDFAGVTMVASGPQVIVANPSLPIKSVTDLIEMARAKPGQLNFASGGSGSTAHLAGELLKMMANINLTHVPYKGGALAMTDVISGQVQMLFFSLTGALPQIKAGRVRAIAVTSAKRSGAVPEIPTVGESGVPGYEATNVYGVLVPAATPKPIVGKLNAEILQVLRSPAVTDEITRQGADPQSSTPEGLENYLKSEIAKWAKVVRAANLRPD
jgi:tripartite-type tricarboxylate transporter receptor subunit TctC